MIPVRSPPQVDEHDWLERAGDRNTLYVKGPQEGIFKRLAEIMRVQGIEDAHIARYAVRKLAAAGLVTLGRAGKEQTVTVTEGGLALCARYGELREALLARATGQGEDALREAAALLRALSGAYDQAARAAATM